MKLMCAGHFNHKVFLIVYSCFSLLLKLVLANLAFREGFFEITNRSLLKLADNLLGCRRWAKATT